MQQKQLAKASGCSESYISRIEKGEMIPNEAIVINLAKALDWDERMLVLMARREKAPQEAKGYYEPGRAESAPGRSGNGLARVPVVDAKEHGEWLLGEPFKLPEPWMGLLAAADSGDAGAFYLVVRGEQMTGGRISDGDRVLIEPNRKCEDGDTVLWFSDGAVTLKRIYQRSELTVLVPAAERREPIVMLRRDKAPRIMRVSQIVVPL